MNVLDNNDVKNKLSDEEENLILNVFNDTKREFDDKTTIHEIFEKQVLKNPNAVAVIFKDEKLTYTQLNDKVDKDMRRTAKAVNFGILYGISSFGLSEDLGIDIKDAKKFIDNYLETFPGIQEFMDNLKSDAYKNGYVKTLMNRKRVVEELKSKNYMIRSS